MAKKVILTAAMTGSIHTPGMSPYFPHTPDQIIVDAVEAHAAGAAVVHIHARNPQDGSPSPDLAIMTEIVSAIKQQCNAVICITTGGAVWMSAEQRLAPAAKLKPELASCNAGSVNFVYSPAADKLTNPKFDWEIPHLKKSDDMVFTNTFSGLEYYIKTMNEYEIRPEFEVYEVGMINNLAFFQQKGLIKKQYTFSLSWEYWAVFQQRLTTWFTWSKLPASKLAILFGLAQRREDLNLLWLRQPWQWVAMHVWVLRIIYTCAPGFWRNQAPNKLFN